MELAVALAAMTRARLVAARFRGAPAAASGRSERTSLTWNPCVGPLTHGVAASCCGRRGLIMPTGYICKIERAAQMLNVSIDVLHELAITIEPQWSLQRH
jgi:hypothetical protein